jgi:putative membrane protein insertion efficiency factor
MILASRASRPVSRPRLLASAHTFYKAALSPIFHSTGLVSGSCCFQPTCSEYATLALAQHGLPRGLWLTLKRLLRCHPFARGGWDPVPPLCSSGCTSPGQSTRPCACSAGDFALKRDPISLQAPPAGTIEMPHPTNDPT